MAADSSEGLKRCDGWLMIWCGRGELVNRLKMRRSQVKLCGVKYEELIRQFVLNAFEFLGKLICQLLLLEAESGSHSFLHLKNNNKFLLQKVHSSPTSPHTKMRQKLFPKNCAMARVGKRGWRHCQRANGTNRVLFHSSPPLVRTVRFG